MMRALTVALCMSLLLSVHPAAAQDYETSIVTGGASGTYIQIGRDIAKIAADCGRKLEVKESAGSLENVLAVRDRPLTQLGIAQSDVLEYVQTFQADDPVLARAAKGIRIAFPLYDEEIHILRIDPDLERRQIERLRAFKARRDSAVVERRIAELSEAASVEDRNLMPVIVAAVKDGVTLGEICDAWRQVWGTWREQPVF